MTFDRFAAALSVVGCLALARPAAAQSADPPPSPERVRVHLRTLREKKPHVARLYIKNDGNYSLVCVSPCTSELPVNSELRVTFDDAEDEPHTFILGPEVGSDVEIEARPASKAPVIGGAVMMGSGGLLALVGVLYLAMASDRPEHSGGFVSFSNRDAYKKFGYIFLGMGAVTSAIGLIWFLTKNNEPRLTTTPLAGPRPQAEYDRRDTFLGDAAFAKPRDSASVFGVSAPVTPLGWSVAF